MPMSLRKNLEVPLICAVFLSCVLAAGPSHASSDVSLSIKVIHAKKGERFVDRRLRALVKDLRGLPFSSYTLKDEATLKLELGSTGRLQLPNQAWMSVTPRSLDNKKLRLDLEVKDYKFKTTVSIQSGKTLALGGPRYDGGILILAVTRTKSP